MGTRENGLDLFGNVVKVKGDCSFEIQHISFGYSPTMQCYIGWLSESNKFRASV